MTVGGSSLVGALVCGNSRGIAVADIALCWFPMIALATSVLSDRYLPVWASCALPRAMAQKLRIHGCDKNAYGMSAGLE